MRGRNSERRLSGRTRSLRVGQTALSFRKNKNKNNLGRHQRVKSRGWGAGPQIGRCTDSFLG